MARAHTQFGFHMAGAQKHTIWGSHNQGTNNLGLTWPGLTNAQFGAHMAGAHKHTIWGSHGLGSQTHNLGLTWLGLTHNLGPHGRGSHTQRHNFELTWPGLTHTQFGAHISQSQSKFILVLFF